MKFSYPYKVKYYETDKMGIVHHSNYVRWLEDARIEFLRSIGIEFKDFETLGILSPVVSVECKYKNVCEFSDDIEISCEISQYNGAKLTLSYEVFNKTSQKLSLLAKSEHAFIYNGRVCALKNVNKEFDDILKEKCKKS